MFLSNLFSRKSHLKFLSFGIRDKQIALGLVILALLIGVIILSIPDADKKANLAANQAMELAEKIRSHYRTKPNYWGLNTNYALENDIVPQTMLRKNKIINSLGQVVLIGSRIDGDAIMPGSHGFDIIFKNVNKKSCMLLMSHSFDENQKLALTSVTLINTKEKVFSWSGENIFPLPILETRKICESKNNIIWNFE